MPSSYILTHSSVFFLAHKVGLFTVHRFPVVFGLTEFLSRKQAVYFSSQAFYAGVDPFNDFN